MTAGAGAMSVTADRRSPIVAALVAGAGCAYLALNDPNDPGVLMPACPTKLVTGLDCPACGGLRMVRALLHGDIRAAARANAFLLVLTPVVAVLWVLWVRSAWRGRPSGLRLSRPVAFAVLTTALAWTVARNLA